MGYPTHLKVKIKTLASEAKIIRYEEKKLFGYRVKTRYNKNQEVVNKSTMKLKPGRENEYVSLHTHRTDAVRKAARSAQLAYGFLRGRRYEQLEQFCHNPPKREEVHRLITRYGGLGHNVYNREMLDLWFDTNLKLERPKVELTG